MSLTSRQRDLCAQLGIPEQLVETILDVAPAIPDYCNTCRQRPCICTLSEFPFGMGESAETPEERDAKKTSEQMKSATDAVSDDLRKKLNRQKDTVTYYPSTDQSTRS